MTDTINVPRELLADLIGLDHDKRINAERSLYATLANAPAQPAQPDLADRLEAFIPRGDGYNSDYANTLTEAVEALRGAHSAQVQGWQMMPGMTVDFSQFLTAVMDAAGLVRHGRQSKELSEYLGSQCMKYRLAAAHQPSDEVAMLRKQLDEARELLTVASEIIHEQCLHIDSPMTGLGSEALTRLDDWLEANQ